jgi:hypothetical protein
MRLICNIKNMKTKQIIARVQSIEGLTLNVGLVCPNSPMVELEKIQDFFTS